jgi:PAS domain S-box-containing protein
MNEQARSIPELLEKISVLKKRIHELERLESERKQAQEAQHRNRNIAERLGEEMAVIAEIGRVIGSTLNIEEVYERFAAEVRKLIPFDRIAVNLHEPHQGIVRVAYVTGEDVPGRISGDSFPLKGSVSEHLVRTKAGIFSHPASVEEMDNRFPDHVATIKAGMRSLMGVPLISRNKVIASLHFRSKKPNAYTEQDLRLAEKIGAQIVGAIANAQLYSDLKETEKALRESEDRYRTLVENASDIVFRTDRAGRFTFVNPAGFRITGYNDEDIIGRPYPAFIRSDMRDEAMKLFGRQLEKGLQNTYSEYPVLTKAGHELWLGQNTQLIVEDGRVTGFQAVARDITKRKWAEEAMRQSRESAERLAEEVAIIAEIGRVVGSTLDINQVYERVATEARKLIPYDRLLVNRKKTQEGEFIVVYITGVDSPGRRIGSLYPSKGSATGVVMNTRTGILIQPTDAEEIKDLYPNLYETFKAGLRSTMSVPLIYMDEVIGSLNFRSKKLKAYTEQDLRLAERIGMQVAGAIANAQLYEDLKVSSSCRECR